jgi:hypothetical protein
MICTGLKTDTIWRWMGKNLEGIDYGIIVNTILEFEWRGRENLEKSVRLACLRTEYEAWCQLDCNVRWQAVRSKLKATHFWSSIRSSHSRYWHPSSYRLGVASLSIYSCRNLEARTVNEQKKFLISSFRRVVNVACNLLGCSPACGV